MKLPTDKIGFVWISGYFPVVPAILLRLQKRATGGFVAIAMKPCLFYNTAMHIVYILKSCKDSAKTYVGMTDNLEKRLKEHNAGLSYYSKRYAPWYIETHIVFNNKELAESFEKYLKEGSGQAFMTKRLLPPMAK